MDRSSLESLVLAALNTPATKNMSLDKKREFVILLFKDKEAFGISLKDIELILDEIIYADIEEPLVFQKKGFTPWIIDAKSEVELKHYFRYENYLKQNKNRSLNIISSINKTTDIILDHMKNPKGAYFSSKGLVIGDVQSGKTANYNGLINKAIDYGYKLVIVLAGMTNDLRLQTQRRLDNEVLGYETEKDKFQSKKIGVALYGKENLVINSFTYASINGGLKKLTSSINLEPNMSPYILVIKKNVSELKNLYEFISKNPILKGEDKKIDIPVLIIDDEVDQASVNTSKKEDLENATSINRNIRKLISKMNRYAYVGYTATPFANIFIDPKENLKDEEKDLFPEDYILLLPTPQNYFGIKEYFGIDGDLDSEDKFNTDLFREVTDLNELYKVDKKTKTSKESESKSIPNSLKSAIKSFIIASAIKRSRGIIEHNSMLIHISHYKNPSTTLKPLLENYIQDDIYTPLMYEKNEILEYKKIWEMEFEKTSRKKLGNLFNDNWVNISKEIINVVMRMSNSIRVLNGDSEDIIDYNKFKEGQHIIIGGNKLSRGLTLEGLVTSYYYRFAKAYDTLMQMGRWFGYKEGWFDLSRIYTDSKLVKLYLEINEAIELFKNDIKFMNATEMTPLEFGLKVRRYPGLVPTAKAKMRRATQIKLSFSGSLSQQTVFNSVDNKTNFNTVVDFTSDLKFKKTKAGNFKASNVGLLKVLEFLKEYKDYDKDDSRVTVKSYIDYIIKCSKMDELKDWTVIIGSKVSEKEKAFELGGLRINKPKRSIRKSLFEENIYKVKALVEGSDIREVLDENDEMYNTINSYKSEDLKIINKFSPSRAMLGIYLIDLIDKDIEGENTVLENVIGISIWFPKSKNEKENSIDFYVNETYITNKSKELGEDVDE